MKRVFDIGASFILVVLFLPLIGVLSLFALFFMGRPIFYKSPRPGLNEKIFTIYKFRTMTSRTDAHNHLLPDKDRLTTFGRLIRHTSLDELPQLFNVLKGDMSLVGPRALLIEYLPLYSSEQKRRHHVRPGITGWAQINGRNAISWQEKFKLDVWYVDHQTLWLDLKIIGLTVIKVFQRSGITQQGHETMEKFKGNNG